MTPIQFSLIVATLGRRDELARLLDSLSLQTHNNFEVIVVDQNAEGFLRDVLDRHRHCLQVIYLRSERGLSRARNVGLRAARGLLVGFPDDDCWYDATVLSAVSDRFASDSRLDGLTGVTRDELGAFSVGRFDETPGEVSRDSVWRRGNSTTIFVTRRLAEQVNGFDESLGVGAASPWQSGEETDFLLRALKAGARIQFDPRLVVRHPQALSLAGSARRKAVLYSRGYMKVVRRHQFGVAFEIRSILVPLVGSLVHVARGRYERAALSFWTALGRLGAVIWPGQP